MYILNWFFQTDFIGWKFEKIIELCDFSWDARSVYLVDFMEENCADLFSLRLI